MYAQEGQNSKRIIEICNGKEEKEMENKKFKIVIASGKGGVGKSMLSSAIAGLFFENRKKVVAVDADVDAPNLGLWLGFDAEWDRSQKISTSEKPTVDLAKCTGCGLCAQNCRFGAITMKNGKPEFNSLVCEGCGACEAICPEKAIKLNPVKNGQINIKKISENFTLASGQLFPGETGSGKVVSELKEQAENFSYDIMVIDSAPGTGCPVIASVQGSNFAILITEPTPSGLSDLKRVLEVVDFFKIPYGVVINKWDINRKLTNKIEKEFKSKILGKISYDQAIFKALANLTPILKTNLLAKNEIKKIYNQAKIEISN